MAEQSRQRLYGSIALAVFAGIALTSFIVALAPELFFDTVDTSGHPIPEVRISGVGSIIVMVVLFLAIGGGAGYWMLTTKSFHLVSVFIAIIAIQGAVYGSYEMWEYHESPEFCVRTCHVMEPAYEQFAEPGINAMMLNHQQNETAECLDCHTGPGIGGQVDLMATSARHVWKYVVTGEYDPDDLGGPDGVKTVPDENCLKCHGEDKVASMPEKHDRFETQCALCHSPHLQNETGYFFPDIILEKEDCSYCHEERPLAEDQVTETEHTAIAEEDCRTCHKTHGLKDVKNVLSCSDAGCHDDDATNNASLVARDHFQFELDADTCTDCHGGSHNLTGPDLELLSKHCQDCHDEGKPLSEGNVHLDVEGIKDGDCSRCHGADPAPWNLDPDIASHGSMRCTECHVEGNDLEAPVPSTEVVVQAQRDRMRQIEHGLDDWNQTGRGNHDPTADCNECHSQHDFSFPVYPDEEGCDSSCHTWLQEDIVSEGFPGRSGTPVYEGPMDPEVLLQVVKDVDSDGRTHTEIYGEWGCTGFCHNPAMTLEIAEAWGVPMTDPAGQSNLPDNLSIGTEHGYINKCTDCHRVQSPANSNKDDLHGTHIAFVSAEMPAYDTSGEFVDACAYCHSTNSPDDPHYGPGGGCYNCHFSGHLPQTYYWGYPPEEMP